MRIAVQLYSRRLVVFAGPIFGDTDPVYRSVQIPLKFFNVAAFPDVQLRGTGRGALSTRVVGSGQANDNRTDSADRLVMLVDRFRNRRRELCKCGR